VKFKKDSKVRHKTGGPPWVVTEIDSKSKLITCRCYSEKKDQIITERFSEGELEDAEKVIFEFKTPEEELAFLKDSLKISREIVARKERQIKKLEDKMAKEKRGRIKPK